MTFPSILFRGPEDRTGVADGERPAVFPDLNLDQVIESVTDGRAEYALEPFFFAPLKSVGAIEYRHAVFQDIERPDVAEALRPFSEAMTEMRRQLGQGEKLHHTYQREAWFLDASAVYCEAVEALLRELGSLQVKSRGLSSFLQYLTDYVTAAPFRALVEHTTGVKEALSKVQYSILIRANRVRVSGYDGAPDYSAEVEATFERFRQGAGRDYRPKFNDWPDVNHVEGQILDFVAQLYPQPFVDLDNFCTEHRTFIDDVIKNFDRELQFYRAYLAFVARIEGDGLDFCYPAVSDTEKAVCANATFDLALATKLVEKRLPIVCNDFSLQGQERILVVSGPNQGGKTTFARTFGQLHYLAALGCPVPGHEARLFLFDQLFTHFEREEDLDTLRGKLEDDVVRVHAVLQEATPNSVVILNEVFSSTTLRDAVFLGKRLFDELIALDLLCVCVTFLDELASLGETTVSMVSTVVPDNPVERTFKIVRQRADGLAYAAALAEKYAVTYARVKARLTA